MLVAGTSPLDKNMIRVSERFKDLDRLAPPPRAVEAKLLLEIFGSGCLVQFGWMWVLFVGVFLHLSGFFTSLTGSRTLTGPRSTVTGVVTGCEKWPLEINEEPVFAIYFEYEVEGQKSSGRSFMTGYEYDPGEAVSVDYSLGDPTIGMLRDGRATPVPLGGVVLFGGIGLLFIAYNFYWTIKSQNLLKNGVVARAKLVSKEATNTEVNEQRVYKFTFEFEDAAGRTQQHVYSTHEYDEITDEDEEPLLYLPHKPSRALLLDCLPGDPKVSFAGGFESRRGLPWGGMILPVLNLALWGYGLYVAFA